MKEITLDYKELYLKMVRASEKAIDLLIHAQQVCEEIYINADAVKEAHDDNTKNFFFSKKSVDKLRFYK